MQCLALEDATDMARSIHPGGSLQIRYQAAENRTVLPENRSIALGNLHVHSRILSRLSSMAGSVMPCSRVP